MTYVIMKALEYGVLDSSWDNKLVILLSTYCSGTIKDIVIQLQLIPVPEIPSHIGTFCSRCFLGRLLTTINELLNSCNAGISSLTFLPVCLGQNRCF